MRQIPNLRQMSWAYIPRSSHTYVQHLDAVSPTPRLFTVYEAYSPTHRARRGAVCSIVQGRHQSSGDVGQTVRDMTDGAVHVSVDALGLNQTFINSLKSLRKMRRHVQIWMPLAAHATPPLPLLDLIYARQITLHGSREIGAHRFSALFGMIRAGRIDPSPLITCKIALSDTPNALVGMDKFEGCGVTVIDRMSE